LFVFFRPLPATSLSRALDILDVHLESGEIFSRWGVPAPLRWFLQSANDEAQQRAWATRMARRAGGSDDKLDTLGDWEWLLKDMLKLSGTNDAGLKSAFGLLSQAEIIWIFFSGLLSTGSEYSLIHFFFSSKADLCRFRTVSHREEPPALKTETVVFGQRRHRGHMPVLFSGVL